MKKAKAVSSGLAGALAIGAGSSAYGAVVLATPPPNIAPLALPTDMTGTSISWDINGDGINDFEFRFRQPQLSTVDWQASIFPLTGNFTFGTTGFEPTFFYAWRFGAGDTISGTPPTGAYAVDDTSQAVLGSRYAGNDYGQFLPPNSRGFLGLQFTTGAGTFFGYVQVQVNRSAGIGLPGFQFISAAFDNTPGTPIIAGAIPEPGTLALLAFGAAGVAAIHRRRKQPKAV